MEQHPVPQNVTTFQFKLIGDITLKQFAYAAGGIILAYILYKFTFIPGLLRIPLSVLSVFLGFGLAFVPIEERPLDRWLSSFIKSIYLPTQFVWKKENSVPEILAAAMPIPVTSTPPAQAQPPATAAPQPTPTPVVTVAKPVVIPIHTQPPKPIDTTLLQPLKAVKPTPPTNYWTLGAPPKKVKSDKNPSETANPKPVTGQRLEIKDAPPTQQASQPDAKQIESLKQDYQELEKRLQSQMQIMQQELQTGSVSKERFAELQQLLSQLMSEKDRLSRELSDTRNQLAQRNATPTVKPSMYKTLPQEHTTVKIVPPTMATQIGVPRLTSYPNVITGIIKDSKGNLLPNVIITVKDTEGMPVRALKSNKIGQFAASTPLASGTYIIELEDPKKIYHFERIEVGLSNQVLPPLEISAISERDAMRTKLAQEIFGRKQT